MPLTLQLAEQDEKGGRCQDIRSAIAFEAKQVFVGGHDIVGLRRQRAFEDGIVIAVLRHGIQLDMRHDPLCHTVDAAYGVLNILRGHVKARQHLGGFIQNGLRHLKRKRALFGEQQRTSGRTAGKKGGNVDVGIESRAHLPATPLQAVSMHRCHDLRLIGRPAAFFLLLANALHDVQESAFALFAPSQAPQDEFAGNFIRRLLLALCFLTNGSQHGIGKRNVGL